MVERGQAILRRAAGVVALTFDRASLLGGDIRSVDEVDLVLAGPGDPPDANTLAERVAGELTRQIRLDLQWVPRERQVVTADPFA